MLSLVAAQFLPVVLIIMLYKKVLNFENMDGKLAFDHLRMKSGERSFSVVLCVFCGHILQTKIEDFK